jgi:acyl-CoA dehydrogenase
MFHPRTGYQPMPMNESHSTSPFTEEEDMYRRTVRAFFDRELDPHAEKFVGDLDYDRAFWRKAGAAGLLGAAIPEEYGGPGASGLCSVVLQHELGRSTGGTTVGTSIGNDIVTSLLVKGGSESLVRRWAPGILSGDIRQCFAVTEAEAGSDITALRTSAVREGDHYVVNGSKIFSSNANKAELIYFVAKTDPSKRGRGCSMFVVEADTPGISRRGMETMGYDAYDVAEIHFDNVRVPAENLLLGEGRAFELIFYIFGLERLEVAARALGEAELAFRLALDYVKERKQFGQRIFDFQNTQFKLAEMKTDIEVGLAFFHDGVRKYRSGNFNLTDGSMLKLWITEMSSRVVDASLQMFGGAGFMREMTISRLYRGNRLHRLYGGTSELQKVSIAKSL